MELLVLLSTCLHRGVPRSGRVSGLQKMEGLCKLRVCVCRAQMQALWPSCNNRTFKGEKYSPKLKKKYCRSKQTPKLIKQVVKVIGMLGLVPLTNEREMEELVQAQRLSGNAGDCRGNAQVPACAGERKPSGVVTTLRCRRPLRGLLCASCT